MPLEHFPGPHHRPGERDPLRPAHTAPHDRHRERSDLRVADAPIGDARDQLLDLIGGKLAAIPLATDQFGYEHQSASLPMKAIKSLPRSSAARVASASVCSWLSGTSPIPSARFVITEIAATRRPQ